MKPEQSKQECCISPLKRSRLTNNLNSSEICDLQSAGPDKENKTVNWSRVSQKIKRNFDAQYKSPSSYLWHSRNTRECKCSISIFALRIYKAFSRGFVGTNMIIHERIMGNILRQNTLSSKFETSVVFKKGNGRTIRLLCRDEVFTMKKY